MPFAPVPPKARPRFTAGKVSPLLLAFAVPALVLIFAGVVLVARGGGRLGGLEPLPYTKYRDDPETLRGNTYLVRGQIDRRLRHEEGKGSVVVVRLLDAGDRPVPVFVPEIEGRNLDPGQRYSIRVVVRRDVLVAEDMEKL